MNTHQAILEQLTIQLVQMAVVGKGEETDSDAEQALKKLIELLFADGVYRIGTVEKTINYSLAALRQQYRGLIDELTSSSPIVMTSDIIAFRRAFKQIQQLVDMIEKNQAMNAISAAALALINHPDNGSYTLNDAQKIAVFSAASLAFTCITGGAGTGKTTVIIKALECILVDDPQCRIALAVPTGKAAQRLNSALHKHLEHRSGDVHSRIEHLQAQTLHRLLGISENSGQAYYHENCWLAIDVLAIDEASMVGNRLFRQIIAALPDYARLILIGDDNQLPAIDDTSVFNLLSQEPQGYTQTFIKTLKQQLNIKSLPEVGTDINLTANMVTSLRQVWRFDTLSVIKNSADAVLANDSEQFIKTLGDDFYPLPGVYHAEKLYSALAEKYSSNAKQLLTALKTRMILCANRQGQYGSNAINAHLDGIFRGILGNGAGKTWYEGRQIIIEKNQPNLGLNNGDIGICKSIDDRWHIQFDDHRSIPVEQLKADHSLAFAITIHKSQGSEYCHVDVVLDNFDAEQPNALINRALIYTGLTRAKQSLAVYGDTKMIEYALEFQNNTQKNDVREFLAILNTLHTQRMKKH